MSWRYVGKEGRILRMKQLAEIMLERHNKMYGQQLRDGTYHKTEEGENALLAARYWVAFAQVYGLAAEERAKGKRRFSIDIRWAGGYGSHTAYQFDLMRQGKEWPKTWQR